MKETKYYEKLPSVQVAAELGTNINKGLSSDEAKKRLKNMAPTKYQNMKSLFGIEYFAAFGGRYLG